MDNVTHISAKRGLLALSPVALFLLLYVAVSAVIGDFYKIPLAVALVVAAVWSVAVMPQKGLTQRLELFSKAAGHSNIIYMIWIFILAGAFASIAKETGAVTATVNLTLSLFPVQYIVPALFVASCLISLAIGTSVGTVVALTPLAVETAGITGASVPFYTAVVMGGAFFGDNLSFISDTTIAATRSQGCKMRDKFIANCWIAVPAAVVTLAIYAVIGHNTAEVEMMHTANPWLVVPYLVVIGAALSGINVTVVLLLGIASSVIAGLVSGHDMIDMAGYMGSGIDSMGDLIIVTLLAAGMLGAIKAAGGITYLLNAMMRHVSGLRGAQTAIAFLVALTNLCTANNTVAIITVGGISREIGERYGVDPRKNASLLDSCSCIVQCLIPYGAQTLLATSLAGISPLAPWPYLYYPWALAVTVSLSIIFLFPRRLHRPTNTVS